MHHLLSTMEGIHSSVHGIHLPTEMLPEEIGAKESTNGGIVFA